MRDLFPLLFLVHLPLSSPSLVSVFPIVCCLLLAKRGCEPHSPSPCPVISCDKCFGDVTSLLSPSSILTYSHRLMSYMELLLMLILSNQLILQPSHFSTSWLFPHSSLSCWLSHPICLVSPARPQENNFSWLRLGETWRSYWGSCRGPLLTWLLGLYMLHGGLSTWSSLTIASGVSWSFTHSCFKAYIS